MPRSPVASSPAQILKRLGPPPVTETRTSPDRGDPEVSERVTVLIREEIELGQGRGDRQGQVAHPWDRVVGLAAVLGFFGVIFVPVTLAWGLDDVLVSGAGGLWKGFLIVTGAFLLGAGVCAYLGWRKVKWAPRR